MVAGRYQLRSSRREPDVASAARGTLEINVRTHYSIVPHIHLNHVKS